jgi:hypothetical protein
VVYLSLLQAADPRATVYASRADYIARNGGDPINNQPPIFDPTKAVCDWSAPAGVYTLPSAGAPNNLIVVNEPAAVVPNIQGPFNYEPAPARAPSQTVVKYGTLSEPVLSEVCMQSEALALASRIRSDTGISLSVAEAPAPAIPIPALTQGTYVYSAADARRVWMLLGTATDPNGQTVSVNVNAATLLDQEQAQGVGHPGKWSVQPGGALLWTAAPNLGLAVAGVTPPDLDPPIALTPTQSVVQLPPMMVLMVQDTAGGTSPTGGSSDAPALQQILALLQQVHADVQGLGKDVGDPTLA